MTEVETGVHESVAGAQAPQESDKEANFAALRETAAEQKQRLGELERHNQFLQQQQAIFQANALQRQEPQAQKPMPWESVNEDDVLTGADLKRTMQQSYEVMQGDLNQQKQELKKMAFKSQYPDYNEVVGYALKEAERNPALSQAMQSSSDPYTLAYEIGKRSEAYQTQHAQVKTSADAKRIMENSQKPGSVNAASTGSGALSKAQHFMSMDDRAFEAHIAKVKRGVL